MPARLGLAQAPNPPSGMPVNPGLIQPESGVHQGASVGVESFAGGTNAGRLLGTPVGKLLPGGVGIKPEIKNPVGGQQQAIERGKRYFNAFNCVGCHAPNAGGGMGPGLSLGVFTYGSEPENIYLSIYQGRPRGMPAWGAMLPDNIIWDLVAYLRNISQPPAREWGTTVNAQSPRIEQVPAEHLNVANPWSQTEAFSNGQKPNRAK